MKISALQSSLNSFIVPLAARAHKGRIHPSLGLNTQTGRLSSRNPNLQNQPALDKDTFRVRDAFRGEEGNVLIVADYSQLELRVLAHMADCKSMITCLTSGGDIHSRTAVDMFDDIRSELDKGNVLLEWDSRNGAAPKPLVKDIYAVQRKQAKTLNFGIAYGLTAIGLSQQWKVSRQEAKDTLERWYRARPEVQEWQQGVIARARDTKAVATLMGRYRPLPYFESNLSVSRLDRIAINTPIQGGAADIVIAAMLKLRNPLLELGFRIVLQIHDEVILEGPKDKVEVAMKRTKELMEHPLPFELRVPLEVDAKWAESWYKAK
eukprot:TRINITY_DN2688_c0_g1_i2.p1 TRINITY_DN2688_c0_g1~~TRINITY_DN2688_c0_g1_i2.p1  ORF type:complete len:321 (-),score=75.77 TRINITY_DN2688_c0_g1_i2:28-990(-)